MKTVIKFVIGLSVLITIVFLFALYGLNLMKIEDQYGGFQDLYYEIDKSDNYFIIIENKEVGLLQKLDDEIFVTVNDCMKHLLNYSDKKIEIYRFEINETRNDFTLKEAILLKNDYNTKLIFKN
jgi:hypothetical protein